LHETSYALMIVDAVMEALKERNLEGAKVKKIFLRVGELSLIDPIALQNAFDALTADIPSLSGAKLEIEIVPAKIKCKNCGRVWSFKELYPELKENIPIIHLYPHIVAELLKCPKCGSTDTEILQGDEFQVIGFEVE